MRAIRLVFLGGLWAALLCTTALAQEPTSKLPEPDADAQAKAMALSKEVYGEEFAQAKTPAQKKALAEKLLQKAEATRSDPPAHCVLLKLARDIAARAGEVELAFRAIHEMEETYSIDGYPLRVDAMQKAVKAVRSPKQHQALVDAALKLMEDALARDDFEGAALLGEAGLASCRQLKDVPLLKKVNARVKEVAEVAAAHEEVKAAMSALDKEPTDPAANLSVGKYFCFAKGDWEKGIPMLALGGDENLKALAVRELGEPAEADEQSALGDAWWERAEAATGIAQKHLRTHAAHWYRLAAPRLTGLQKDKVQQRLALQTEPEVKPKTAGPAKSKRRRQPELYVFTDEPTVKKNWQIVGTWRIEGDGLRLTNGGSNIRSERKLKGNVAIQIMYTLADYCELDVRVFGESMRFRGDGIHIVSIMRKGDTIFFAIDKQSPSSVKIKQERLEVESDLAIFLQSRYSSEVEVLVRGVAILEE